METELLLFLRMPVNWFSGHLLIGVIGQSEWRPAEGKSVVNKDQHVQHIVNEINLSHYFQYFEM